MGLLDDDDFDIYKYYEEKILNWAYNHETYGYQWFKPLMREGYEVRIFCLNQVTDPSKYYFYSSIDYNRRIIILKLLKIVGEPSLVYIKGSREVIDEHNKFVTLQNVLEYEPIGHGY